MNSWYSTLNKPALTPPDWVFAPVWTVLYATIAASIFIYYRSPEKRHVPLTTVVLAIHLTGNLVWTYLFFGLRSPGAALGDIIVLLGSLILIIEWFSKVNRLSGACARRTRLLCDPRPADRRAA